MATKKATSPAKRSTAAKPKVKAKTSTVKATAASRRFSLLGNRPLKRLPLIGVLVAEFVGTFLLVASIFAVQGQPLFVAFAVVGIVLIVGAVSGSHINPAVTIGAWVTGRLNSLRALGYIAAQILGAVVAWLVLATFLRGTESEATQLLAGSGPQLFHAAAITEGKEWYILFAELLGTTILALGVASALRVGRDRIFAALSYGFAILIGLLVAGSVTAMFLTEANTGLTFLNPAVAFAANGVSWSLWPILAYVVAPALGGIIGFVLQDFLQAQAVDNKA